MSGIRQGSHLEHLHELRDRVDAAIVEEEKRARAADERRAVLAAESDKQAQVAAREAAKAAAREQRLADREEAAQAHLEEVERIETAAPADVVRTWAREHNIPVGDRGRIPLDLRKQYLEDTQETRP